MMKARNALSKDQRETVRRHIKSKTRYVNKTEGLEEQSVFIQLYRIKTLSLLADALYSLDSGDYHAMSEQLNRAEQCLYQLAKLTVGKPV